MAKFVKGDILYFKREEKSFHNVTYDIEIDKCIVVYIDDNYYHFNSSRLDSMIYDLEQKGKHVLTIPISEIDDHEYKYTLGLKTLFKKL